MIAFSTPFDETAVDFLESLDAPCYKIASFENTDLPLIRQVAATGKPMIVSTGMASVAELDETVRAAREAGCRDLVLLKCTSTYPATPENTNIAHHPASARAVRLPGRPVGSHHGHGRGGGRVALGATVIEKHFTLARADGGVDASFSLEPAELASLVVESERAWQALGRVTYGPQSEQERKSLAFRRSLYVVRDVKAGELFTRENVRAIRPGFGLAPKHLEQVLGRRTRCDVARGTPVAWDLLG